jgi:hypothetical protein
VRGDDWSAEALRDQLNALIAHRDFGWAGGEVGRVELAESDDETLLVFPFTWRGRPEGRFEWRVESDVDALIVENETPETYASQLVVNLEEIIATAGHRPLPEAGSPMPRTGVVCLT